MFHSVLGIMIRYLTTFDFGILMFIWKCLEALKTFYLWVSNISVVYGRNDFFFDIEVPCSYLYLWQQKYRSKLVDSIQEIDSS